MKSKQLIILGSLLVVAIIVAAMLKGGDDKGEVSGPAAGDLVFPALPVNDITSVKITSDEKSVALKRSGETWGVADRDGYAADFRKLSSVLKNLRDLKVADAVRAGESSYGRLEIKDPGSEKDDKAGTLVELRKGDDSLVASLVLGKNYSGASDGSGSSQGGSGRYVREGSNKEHVYIVSESFYEIDPSPNSWLKRDFFRVEKHKSITITHPGGEVFKFSRADENGKMEMEGLADTEELNTTNTGTISSAFSSASFKDVAVGDAAKPEATGHDKAIQVDIETFDGFRYAVKLGKSEPKNPDTESQSASLTPAGYFLTFEVSAELPAAREPEEDEKVADDASDEDKKKAEDLKKQRDETFESDQKRLKEKLEKEKAFVGHVYEIDSWAAEKFFKKRDELVKEKEKEEKADDVPLSNPNSPVPLPDGASSPVKPSGEPKIVATSPPISLADVLAEEAKKKSEEGEVEKVEDKGDKAEEEGDKAEEEGDKAEEEGEKSEEPGEATTEPEAEVEATGGAAEEAAKPTPDAVPEAPGADDQRE